MFPDAVVSATNPPGEDRPMGGLTACVVIDPVVMSPPDDCIVTLPAPTGLVLGLVLTAPTLIP